MSAADRIMSSQYVAWLEALYWAQVFARRTGNRWQVWRDSEGYWRASPKPVRL